MITDKNLRVSEDQVLTINATTALSTYSIDKSVLRDLGEGKELFFNFAITEVVAAAATSVTFEIVETTDAALTGSLKVIGSTGKIGYALLTLGANVAIPIPPQIGSKGLQYIGIRYSVEGNNSGGTGKVTTDVVETIQDGKKFYPSGFTVT